MGKTPNPTSELPARRLSLPSDMTRLSTGPNRQPRAGGFFLYGREPQRADCAMTESMTCMTNCCRARGSWAMRSICCCSLGTGPRLAAALASSSSSASTATPRRVRVESVRKRVAELVGLPFFRWRIAAQPARFAASSRRPNQPRLVPVRILSDSPRAMGIRLIGRNSRSRHQARASRSDWNSGVSQRLSS